MRGWQLKPLGWLVVIAVLALVAYIGYKVLTGARRSKDQA